MMYVGMLWFDNDNKSELITRVERAANYYHHKYGRLPNLCFVHPSMLAQSATTSPPATVKTDGVEVRGMKTVLPNHFWIGINQEG